MSVFRVNTKKPHLIYSDLIMNLTTPFKYMIPYDMYLNCIYTNISNSDNSSKIYNFDVLLDNVTIKKSDITIHNKSHIYKLECFGYYIKKDTILSINSTVDGVNHSVYMICYFNKDKIKCEDVTKEVPLSQEELIHPDQLALLDSLLS